MITPMSIRILYLGRNKKLPKQIDDALHEEMQQMAHGMITTPVLQFVQATSQKQAHDEIRISPPHGVLVETTQGRYSHNRFCQTLRGRLPKTLIISVQPNNYQDSFTYDGFIYRPFVLEQARTALVQLLGGGQKMYLHVGDLHLDVAMRTVDGPQGTHHLPPKLCKLLQVLMENRGDTLQRGDLMQMVWETKFLGDTRTLDVHIRWLREKIEPVPSHPTRLVTVRGEGYRLNE
ncbi:MAG: winged helix-turn-helix domain-containing protein [Caldilineaceae bacterium]|nr:winged helix-turn-helix domain-containing protein [Caldilineaceae bacterium]